MINASTFRSMARAAGLAVATVAALVSPALYAQGQPTTGPDVTVIDIFDIDSYGGSDGFLGYAVGTTSCNIGDDELNWCNSAGCAADSLPNSIR